MKFREIIRSAFGKPQPLATPAAGGGDAPATSAPLRQSKPSEQEFKNTLALAMDGDVSARRKVGILYYRGFGVRPNPPQAMKWLMLAAEQGDPKADEYLGLMQQAMTPEEIAGGQRLLARFKGQPEPVFAEEDVTFESPEEVGLESRSRSEAASATGWTPSDEESVLGESLTADESFTAAAAEPVGRFSAKPSQPARSGASNHAEAMPPAKSSIGPALVWTLLAAVVVTAVGGGLFWLMSRPVKEFETPPAPVVNMSMPLPQSPLGVEPAPTPVPPAAQPQPQPPAGAPPSTELQRVFTEAQAGNLQAQFLTGLVHAEGKLVPANLPEAARWFALAAERGHADAQNNLAIFHIRGLGVPKDLVVAYKWMSLARAGGNRDAAVNEETLRKMLNPEELSRAQAQVAQFSPKK